MKIREQMRDYLRCEERISQTFRDGWHYYRCELSEGHTGEHESHYLNGKPITWLQWKPVVR